MAGAEAAVRRPHGGKLWLGLLLGSLLWVAGWIATVEGNAELAMSAVVLLVAIPAAYGLWRGLAFVAAKLDSIDFFSPWIAFPLAYVLWFTLGTCDFIDDPFHALYGMFDPMPAAIWGYAALGLTAYLCGVFVASRPKRCFPRQVKEKLANRWHRSLHRAAMAGFILLLLGSYVTLAVRMGIPVLSSGAAEDRLLVGNFGPTQAIFLCSAWTLMVLLPASCWIGRLQKPWMFIGLTGVAVLLLSMGGRGNFFVGALTLLVASHYLRRRLGAWTLLAGALALFVAFSAYGYVRDTAFVDRDSFSFLEQLGVPAAAQPFVYAFTYIRGTVATLRDVVMIIPSEIPYQHGHLSLLALRTLLPGHHEMADMFFKNILGHDFVGLGQPATLLGPLYGDMGTAGIACGMFVFGAIAGSLYRRIRRQPTVRNVWVYAWATQTGIFGLFGSLFPYISTLFVPLLWCLLDWFLRFQAPAIPPPQTR